MRCVTVSLCALQAIIQAQLELSTGATCGTPGGDVVEFDDMLVKVLWRRVSAL